MVDLRQLFPGAVVKVVDKPVTGSLIVSGEGMGKFLGKIVTLREVFIGYDGRGGYATIEEDPMRFAWGPADFEYIDQREDSFEAPSMEDFLASISSLGYCAPEERRIL